MAMFSGGSFIDLAGFNAIKDGMVVSLATVIEEKLCEMGDEVKGVTWFSSIAETYASEIMGLRKAA